MMMGIQADDLTGSRNAGAPIAARGLETIVLLPGASDSPGGASESRGADVLVLDTESPALPGAEAAQRRGVVDGVLQVDGRPADDGPRRLGQGARGADS